MAARTPFAGNAYSGNAFVGNEWDVSDTPPPTTQGLVCLSVELEPLVDLSVNLGECGGVSVSAIYYGNDTPVRIIGANIDGTYLNAATCEFTIYGDDDETVIFGPEPMTYVTASNGEYEGTLSSDDIATMVTAGDMTIGNSYRLTRTLVEGTDDARTDTYYPLLYRSGAC